MKLRYMAITVVSVSLLLAGCGADTSTDTPTDTTGNDSTPTVTGVVSFSSASEIAVNNVSYDITAATTFTKEGLPAEPGLISEGMVVTVEGPHANGRGVAHKVRYDSEVEGFVVMSDITLVPDSDPMTYTGTMDVMGQAIIIDEMTKFSGTDDPTLIVANNVVEVSGMFQDDGSVLAKHVEYKAAELMSGDEIEIKGYVTAYDPTGGDDQLGSFMLGACTINVTPNTDNEIAVLEDGMKVEVESKTEDILKTDPCEINAGEIENKDHNGYRDMDYVEGMVVGDLVDGKFMVQHGDKEPVPVMIDDNTHYMNGTEESIVAGAKLKAVGKIDDNNVLMARLIKFEKMEIKFDKVYGEVVADQVDGMFDLLDKDGNTVTVVTTVDTHFLPKDATVMDIKAGVILKAIGEYDVDNKLVAKLIKLEGVDIIKREQVRGEVVSDLVDGTFDVMNRDGVTVAVVVNVDTQYFPKGATEADIKQGVMLMAVGMFEGDTLVANMIRLKGMGDVKPPMPGVPPMIKYDGVVEDIVISDPAKPELGGTLTIMGQAVTITADTRIFKVMSPIEPMPPINPMPVIEPMPQPILATGGDAVTTILAKKPLGLTLADITVGDSVMVMAYYDDKGVLSARLVEVKFPPDTGSKVFGPITAADVTLGTLTIAGVTVMVDEVTRFTPMGTDVASIKTALDNGDELKAMAKGSYDAITGLKAKHIAVHRVVVIM